MSTKTTRSAASGRTAHPVEPTLLPGGVADWPALRSWRPDALVARVGVRDVPVESYPRGLLGSDAGRFRMMTFADYIQAVTSGTGGESLYLADVRLREVFPELAADVRPPDFLSGRRLQWLMFYGVDSFTALHFHSQHQAMLCQVIGEKRVVLIRPSARPRIPLNSWYSRDFHIARRRERADQSLARVDPRDVIDVVLRPGDALTIPVGWLHVVEGSGLSASLTFFWRSWLDIVAASRHRPTLLASLALWSMRQHIPARKDGGTR